MKGCGNSVCDRVADLRELWLPEVFSSKKAVKGSKKAVKAAKFGKAISADDPEK